MEKMVVSKSKPDDLDTRWDEMAHCYYLKREFLTHLHTYNYCDQRYYELHENGVLTAGTIVYSMKVNILTFLNFPSPVKFRIIGLPISIASEPYVGDEHEIEYLLSEIIKEEKGLILGLNFKEDYLPEKFLNLRTLPTIVLNLPFGSMEEYEGSLRHPYRRRLHRIKEKFTEVDAVDSSCLAFNEEHYALYLQVMKTTTTKLEILKAEVFKYLPAEFELTTYYSNGKMLFWHILCLDKELMYYFMCGMNYALRDQFHIYNNSLFEIISTAMKNNYSRLDLGQTAEIAKTRIGGVPDERRMFMFHRNKMVMSLLRLFQGLIAYSKHTELPKVFKKVERNTGLTSISG